MESYCDESDYEMGLAASPLHSECQDEEMITDNELTNFAASLKTTESSKKLQKTVKSNNAPKIAAKRAIVKTQSPSDRKFEPEKNNFPHRSVGGWLLFVTSIHDEAEEDEIKELFSEYGTVTNIHMNLDRRSGFVKGYAIVEFKKFDEAEKARRALDQYTMLGHPINVDWAIVQR